MNTPAVRRYQTRAATRTVSLTTPAPGMGDEIVYATPSTSRAIRRPEETPTIEPRNVSEEPDRLSERRESALETPPAVDSDETSDSMDEDHRPFLYTVAAAFWSLGYGFYRSCLRLLALRKHRELVVAAFLIAIMIVVLAIMSSGKQMTGKPASRTSQEVKPQPVQQPQPVQPTQTPVEKQQKSTQAERGLSREEIVNLVYDVLAQTQQQQQQQQQPQMTMSEIEHQIQHAIQMEKNTLAPSLREAEVEKMIDATVKDAVAAIRKEISASQETSMQKDENIRQLVKETATALFSAEIRKLHDGLEVVKERLQRPTPTPSPVGITRNDVVEIVSDSLQKTIDGLKRDLQQQQQYRLEIDGRQVVTEFPAGRIQDMIDRALRRYQADVIGKPDYALHSVGASISGTTEPYCPFLFPCYFYQKTGVVKLPHVMLEPSMNFGDCYALKGTAGNVTIKLSARVNVTSVTIDHISKLHNPYLKSAPKEFRVFAVDNETSTELVTVESPEYVVDIAGKPDGPPQAQTFHIKNPTVCKVVQLRILSNHGHQPYTCIYRFRVHGDAVELNPDLPHS